MILRTTLILFAVASLSVLPRTSHAAFITHTSSASFNAAVSGLVVSGSTGFEADQLGGKPIGGFTSGGIGFVGSTMLPSPGALPLAVITVPLISSTNYLGVDHAFSDFAGGAAPSVGDILTINVPANSQAIGLTVVTNQPADFTSFARLAVGSTSVDLFNGQPGTVLPLGLISYFLGISSVLPSDQFSTATLSFVGGGTSFLVDDVAIYSIPEPNSLALVGLTSLAGLIRRRVRLA